MGPEDVGLFTINDTMVVTFYTGLFSVDNHTKRGEYKDINGNVICYKEFKTGSDGDLFTCGGDAEQRLDFANYCEILDYLSKDKGTFTKLSKEEIVDKVKTFYTINKKYFKWIAIDAHAEEW